MLDSERSVKHTATLLSIDHNNKRAAGLSAGGAFLCAEAWQSVRRALQSLPRSRGPSYDASEGIGHC